MSVSEALEPILRVVTRVASISIPVSQAHGARLAGDIVAPKALPGQSLALRAGYAVRALDLVGASPHAPATRSEMPALLEPGMALPSGCDAILPVDAVSRSGALIEITRSGFPGENVRLAGHDLPAGSVIVAGGTILSPTLQWAAHLAGVEHLEIRRPRIGLRIAGAEDRRWLAALIVAMGCEPVENFDNDTIDLMLISSSETTPRLALSPGEAATIALHAGSIPEIRLPPRFDGLVAAFFCLVLPVLERLAGGSAPRLGLPLARKLTSTVGVTEIALLKITEAGFLPLGAREITLASLMAADTVAILGPENEGLAQGSPLMAIPLDLNPFHAANPRQSLS